VSNRGTAILAVFSMGWKPMPRMARANDTWHGHPGRVLHGLEAHATNENGSWHRFLYFGSMARNLSNKYRLSCGPAEDSG
jgi:hypothetical protein